MNLDQKLSDLRIEKGLKQKEVADAINVSKSSVGNYESGANFPDYDVLVRFANFYNVNIDWLLDNTSTRKSWADVDKEIELPDNQSITLRSLAELIEILDLDERYAILQVLNSMTHNVKYLKHK